MANTDTPLTERQITVLQAISDGADYTVKSMMEKVRLPSNGQRSENTTFNVRRLESIKLIDISPRKSKGPSSERIIVFRITDAGRAALHEALVNQRLYGGVVTPPRSDGLANRPLWVPPKNVYYRNNGNSHIKSLGVCIND